MGLFNLTLKSSLHLILAGKDCFPPINAGHNPTIPTGTTGLRASEIIKNNKEVHEKFIKCMSTSKALKSQLIRSVNEVLYKIK